MTAAEQLLQKTLVGSGLNSNQWSQVQAGLRDRAFFSSRVESAKILHAARGMIAEGAAGRKSESEIRRDLREILDAEGYTAEPGKEGTLEDLRGRRRLDLIIETNTRQARGYVHELKSRTPESLAEIPAQELVRTFKRRAPRDWTARWKAAGGRLYKGRMVALVGDPVWTAISRFGTPWPPFDFGSGMGVEGVFREEAIALGVIREGDPPPKPAPIPGFNDTLEAEVPFAGKDSPEWEWLQESFGDQIKYVEGTDGSKKMKWRMDVIKSVLDNPSPGSGVSVRLGKSTPELLGKASRRIANKLADTSLSIPENWLRHLLKRGHIGDLPDDERNIKLVAADLDLLPSLWRNPDRVAPGEYPSSAVLELDTYDGGTIRFAINTSSGAMPLTLYKRSGL